MNRQYVRGGGKYRNIKAFFYRLLLLFDVITVQMKIDYFLK